jgi:hypothetical protein
MYSLSYGYYDENMEHRHCRANVVPPAIKDKLQDMAKQGLPDGTESIRYSYADAWTVTVTR